MRDTEGVAALLLAVPATTLYMLTSTTCLLQNIAEWEMTDQDIEVAIKLADKSGDGRIDYDEFIAFVFGEDEPVQRLQHTGTNSVHPEPQASEIQSATSHIPPQSLLLPADGIYAPADAPQLPADGPEMPAGSLQLQTDASQMPAEPDQKPSDSCSDGDPAPSTRIAPQHQLPFFSPALQQADDPDLSVQQQSMTDRWVASQTEAVTQPAGEQAGTLATSIHSNALYQADEQSNVQSGAAGDHWHAEHHWHARQPPQVSSDQPGNDDVRLRIQSDDTEPNQSQLFASHGSSEDDDDHYVSPSVYSGVHRGHASQGSQHQDASSSQTLPPFQHNMQRATEVSDLPSTIDDDREEGRPSCSSSEGQSGCVSEPGRLQAAWHGDSLHLSLPPEVAVQTTEHPSQSCPSPSGSFAKPGHAQQAHNAGPPARFTRVLSKPRKLPPLSRAQLSQGVNRSRVGQQQLDGLAHTP